MPMNGGDHGTIASNVESTLGGSAAAAGYGRQRCPAARALDSEGQGGNAGLVILS
jgi:hypothetical protein